LKISLAILGCLKHSLSLPIKAARWELLYFMDITLVTSDHIARKIHFIRGERVLLDSDLAVLYCVDTKVLKQAVRRNLERFPDDFLFQLTLEEWECLRSQIVTLDEGRGKHSKYLPFAFTEQGVAMLSSVLRSKRAVLTNIAIMRAFVALRNWMQSSKDLAAKIRQLEKKYDQSFKLVFHAIQQIIKEKKMKPIGFKIGRSKTK
jgi:hypothetical protein